ncbi:MAG: nucleotidyltransferase family protein [Chloroflexota bacterium]
MALSSTTALEFIVQAISDTGDSLENLRTLAPQDWDTVVVTAIALGLAPLLHQQLVARSSNLALPPPALARLAVTRQAHAKRNQAIAGQLAEILAACAAAPIEVMVLKGALLAPTVYHDPALRPMNDIDLLFRPEDLARVGAVLESLGYGGKHKDAGRGPGVTKHLSTYRRRAGHEGTTPNPYLSAGGDRTVEPHGSLEESWFGLKVDITPGVWARAVPLTQHGRPAYRLSTPDLLLHLAVHAVFHVIMGSLVFVQLYDIRQVLTAWSAELDWSEILALARQARAQPFLYAGLYWAGRIFDAPRPDAPLAELAQAVPSELLAYIHSLDTVAILKRTQQPPLVTLGQRLRRGLADRHEAARWAGSWRGKWQVWQTALAVHKTDTAGLLQKRLKVRHD